MTTAAADGLEEESVGGGALGEEGAVGVEGDVVGVTTGATGTAHGEGSGEVSAGGVAGIDGTADTTTTTDGLEENAHGVIASGGDSEIGDL